MTNEFPFAFLTFPAGSGVAPKFRFFLYSESPMAGGPLGALPFPGGAGGGGGGPLGGLFGGLPGSGLLRRSLRGGLLGRRLGRWLGSPTLLRLVVEALLEERHQVDHV